MARFKTNKTIIINQTMHPAKYLIRAEYRKLITNATGIIQQRSYQPT
jgi:hypothetical protein